MGEITDRKHPIIICIDFDETIVVNDPFPDIKGFVQDADYYIRKLHEEGFYIIVWTCRHGEHERQAREFLCKHSVPFDQLNTHHPGLIEHYKNDTRKISGDVYVDDKCLMGLPSWKEIYSIIKNKHIQKPVLSVINS